MNALQRDLKKLVPLVESLGKETVAADPHRQRFHLQPPVGWLNDPQRPVRLRRAVPRILPVRPLRRERRGQALGPRREHRPAPLGAIAGDALSGRAF